MENSRYQAFIASVETGSFSKAAAMINYTPSGVCQLVNALEKELGFQLLVRDKKGVHPTAEGQKALPIMRDIIFHEKRLQQFSAEVHGLDTGKVTIGAYSSIATHWLPSVIREFREAYPHVEFSLLEGIRQETEGWLEDRTVDLVFQSNTNEGAPSAYEWIPLAEDQMLAILPLNHPLANASAYPLSTCPSERFIMPGKGGDEDVLEMFQRNKISPKIYFSTLENFAAMAMIEQGMGMSIMNELITKRWDFKVARLPLDPPQHIKLGIAIPSLEHASPAVRQFINFAVRRLRQEG